MRQAARALKLISILALLLTGAALPLQGQDADESEAQRAARLARRGAGIRAGTWDVDVAFVEKAARSPQYESYYQRGFDQHLALEHSLSVWRVKTSPEGFPQVETRTYIAPLLTSLKVYPVTSPGDMLEPYLLGGIGFAFGVEDESENAIGGGGTTVVTGVAIRGAVGVEMTLGGPLGIAAAGKYQWVYFGEELINTKNVFSGVGVEGAVTYRFQF
jgi:hypothetical protein